MWFKESILGCTSRKVELIFFFDKFDSKSVSGRFSFNDAKCINKVGNILQNML